MGRRLKRAIQRVGHYTVNLLALFSLRTGMPIYPLGRRTLIAVETVGRRTGRRRITPMGFVHRDGRILVVSEHGTGADWYRNARAAGAARVQYRGRWAPATLVPTDLDPRETLGQMRSRSIAAFNRVLWHRPRVIEIRLEPGGDGDR